MMIAKLRRTQFGRSSEQLEAMIDQLQLSLDELQISQAEMTPPVEPKIKNKPKNRDRTGNFGLFQKSTAGLNSAEMINPESITTNTSRDR